jgi:hypothetical protein
MSTHLKLTGLVLEDLSPSLLIHRDVHMIPDHLVARPDRWTFLVDCLYFLLFHHSNSGGVRREALPKLEPVREYNSQD